LDFFYISKLFYACRNEMSLDDAGLGGRLATFVCLCSKRTKKFHGSLSAIMEEPLGTVPLHLFMAGKVSSVVKQINS